MGDLRFELGYALFRVLLGQLSTKAHPIVLPSEHSFREPADDVGKLIFSFPFNAGQHHRPASPSITQHQPPTRHYPSVHHNHHHHHHHQPPSSIFLRATSMNIFEHIYTHSYTLPHLHATYTLTHA